MFSLDCLGINSSGHLTIGGCDTIELAQKYGTPLYVMDESTIRNSCKKYKESFEKNYDGNGRAFYASKAFNCKEICRIVKDEGLGLDVVSGGELFTAMQVDFPPELIHFHGNNKTVDEMRMALNYGVGKFVVDNLTELEVLNSLAEEMGKVAPISMRIKPGIDAHTHKFIQTGQIDSKFGFALETGEALSSVKKALQMKHISLQEFHCHIGSQIFDVKPFVAAAEVMLTFIAEVKRETGVELRELNLGGGFGIKYVESDEPVSYEEYMKIVSTAVKAKCAELGLTIPTIYMEPGRSIVGEAGITLYEVGSVKNIPNVRTYVSVDGGMTDNPRYILYQSEYTAVVANKANLPADHKVTIAGRCCESGDLIQENTMIQKVEPKDILAVLSTGAYNYSMASHYNRVPNPAVVMVCNGKDRLIIKRETYEDLIKNDL